MPEEPLLKAREVARLLGLEMGTVLDHFEAGELPGFRLWGRRGGPVRFRRSDVEAWLEKSCRVGDPAMREHRVDVDERTADEGPNLRGLDHD